MLCSVGVALADYESTLHTTYAGYSVDLRNYISNDRKSCGASTTSGNSNYAVSVSLTYYYSDAELGKVVINGYGNGGTGSTGVNGPNLGLYKYYIKVDSHHVVTCPGYSYSYIDDLATLAP